MKISIDDGFEVFDCDKGISSEVFKKGNYVYKVSTRNSIRRAIEDYSELKKIVLSIGFGDKLQESEISSCKIGGYNAICVKQRIIDGKTIAMLGKDGLTDYLKEQPQEVEFLKKMIGIFFNRVQSKQLYPDLVGNPSDQSLWNSINLMIDGTRGIIVCDVGLSPHEKTLEERGELFFSSENVMHYEQRMRESLSFLNTLS